MIDEAFRLALQAKAPFRGLPVETTTNDIDVRDDEAHARIVVESVDFAEEKPAGRRMIAWRCVVAITLIPEEGNRRRRAELAVAARSLTPADVAQHVRPATQRVRAMVLLALPGDELDRRGLPADSAVVAWQVDTTLDPETPA